LWEQLIKCFDLDSEEKLGTWLDEVVYHKIEMLVTNVQWAKAEIEKGKLNFDYITSIAQAACSRDLTLSIALDMSKVPNWIYDAYPSARISFPVFDSYFISTSHSESMTKANIFLDVYTKY